MLVRRAVVQQSFREIIFPLVVALGDAALFEARYFIYDGYIWGCTAPSNPCGNQVTVASGLACMCTHAAHASGPRLIRMVPRCCGWVVLIVSARTVGGTARRIRIRTWSAACQARTS